MFSTANEPGGIINQWTEIVEGGKNRLYIFEDDKLPFEYPEFDEMIFPGPLAENPYFREVWEDL